MYTKMILFTLFIMCARSALLDFTPLTSHKPSHRDRYPRLSSAVLRLYVCQTVEGKSYLVADFNIQCFDARWNGYAAANAFMVRLRLRC